MPVSSVVVVRTLHVLGMVVLLGGAASLWHAARTGNGEFVAFAKQYEWAFWGAIGVMVVTGIGNMGTLGAPGLDTRWGTILGVKLVLVVGLVFGSLVRTLALVQPGGPADPARFCRRAYGATAAILFVLVVLAEVLTYG